MWEEQELFFKIELERIDNKCLQIGNSKSQRFKFAVGWDRSGLQLRTSIVFYWIDRDRITQFSFKQ